MEQLDKAESVMSSDLILSQGQGSLQEILAGLHQLEIPDDFLSPAERAHAQERPQNRVESAAATPPNRPHPSKRA